MLQVAIRIAVMTVAALWLGGCGSTGIFASLKPAEPAVDGTDAMAADLPASTVARTTTTTTTTTTEPAAAGPATAESSVSALAPIAPADDDVILGRKYYRAGAFGLAEKHFRHAVEMHPEQAEAWLGLAASYDQLRRFDLADRAYAQALRLAGPSVAIINNQGYSYLLRGDYKAAREKLQLARSKAPDNPYVKSNLQLLAAKTGTKTGATTGIRTGTKVGGKPGDKSGGKSAKTAAAQ
jgi:Flp pilus assembly protein TadD